MWFSLAAVLIATAPGLRAFWTFELQEYDGPTAVLTATLIAVIWSAHYTHRSVKHAKEQHEYTKTQDARAEEKYRTARLSLLAAVRSDMDDLGQSMSLLKMLGFVEARDWLRVPHVDQALARADLLKPDEAVMLAELLAGIRLLESWHNMKVREKLHGPPREDRKNALESISETIDGVTEVNELAKNLFDDRLKRLWPGYQLRRKTTA